MPSAQDPFYIVKEEIQDFTIGSLEKKHLIGSFELLSKTTPIQVISLLVFGPFVDYFLTVYSWAVEADKSKALEHVKTSMTKEEIRILKEGIENTPLKDVELGESKE